MLLSDLVMVRDSFGAWPGSLIGVLVGTQYTVVAQWKLAMEDMRGECHWVTLRNQVDYHSQRYIFGRRFHMYRCFTKN